MSGGQDGNSAPAKLKSELVSVVISSLLLRHSPGRRLGMNRKRRLWGLSSCPKLLDVRAVWEYSMDINIKHLQCVIYQKLIHVGNLFSKCHHFLSY